MSKEIKLVDKKIVEDLKGKIFPKDKIIEEDILITIATISARNRVEIALITNRKGQIVDVVIGDSSTANISIDYDKDGNRLSGYGVIHTHPFATANLSEQDKIVLKKCRLDYMCAIAVDDRGLGGLHIAVLDDGCIKELAYEYAGYINKYGIQTIINDAIERDKKSASSTISTEAQQERAVLVAVDINKSQINMRESLEELRGLCKTNGIEVVDVVTQNKATPDPKFMLGKGKVEELKTIVDDKMPTLVVFENELSASRQSNLSQYLGVKVLDRSMLILDIFANHARTNEGKLQVELAQLKYMLPRLKAYVDASNRYGGGVGMRGPGETKLELNRRVIENNIKKKSDELKKLKQHRDLNRKNRRNNSKPTVSIVGYTNSGKSSLLNLLAKDNIYAKDELFATVDTTSRNVWLGDRTDVIFTDTVGFISNLPHEFIEAFSSTLEECIYSDLLLLVVDISNPNYESQIRVSMDVLDKIGSTVPIVKVYNKVDKIDMDATDLSRFDDGILISVKTGYGIEKLKTYIKKYLK